MRATLHKLSCDADRIVRDESTAALKCCSVMHEACPTSAGFAIELEDSVWGAKKQEPACKNEQAYAQAPQDIEVTCKTAVSCFTASAASDDDRATTTNAQAPHDVDVAGRAAISCVTAPAIALAGTACNIKVASEICDSLQEIVEKVVDDALREDCANVMQVCTFIGMEVDAEYSDIWQDKCLADAQSWIQNDGKRNNCAISSSEHMGLEDFEAGLGSFDKSLFENQNEQPAEFQQKLSSLHDKILQFLQRADVNMQSMKYNFVKLLMQWTNEVFQLQEFLHELERIVLCEDFKQHKIVQNSFVAEIRELIIMRSGVPVAMRTTYVEEHQTAITLMSMHTVDDIRSQKTTPCKQDEHASAKLQKCISRETLLSSVAGSRFSSPDPECSIWCDSTDVHVNFGFSPQQKRKMYEMPLAAPGDEDRNLPDLYRINVQCDKKSRTFQLEQESTRKLNVDAHKAECEYCGQVYKISGLKKHMFHCRQNEVNNLYSQASNSHVFCMNCKTNIPSRVFSQHYVQCYNM